jgi:hypothetical protein
MAAVMATVPDFAAWEADFAKAFAARGAGSSSTHFGYSYAKLGTSVCKDAKCKEKIAKCELRVYKDTHLPFALDGSLSRTYYHPECFFMSVMSRARKWGFEHADELENFSTLTAEDAARVEGLIAEGTKPSDKQVKAKKAAKAKFEKAQARADAKFENDAHRAAKKAKKAKKVMPEPEPEVDYSEVDAWTLEAAKSLKDDIRKAKARAYYQAHKEQVREYQRKYRETHPRGRKVVAPQA